jgi:hypothetical protein
MSLQLLGVGEHAVQLEKVITLFANANDENLTTSPRDGGCWNHLKFEDAVVKMQELSLLRIKVL